MFRRAPTPQDPNPTPATPRWRRRQHLTAAGLIVTGVALLAAYAPRVAEPATARPPATKAATVAPDRPGDDLSAPVVPTTPAPPPTGPAYRLVAADGGVFTHGWYRHAGSLADHRIDPVVSLAHTPSGDGYWLASADGGVFTFGDAGFHGSIAGHRLRAPIADLNPTATGGGYWLAARDGGVFTFGDAAYHGGIADIPVSQPVAAMAATPTGGGYWLAGADGGVFAFGDAGFHGSVPGLRGRQRIVAVASTPTGNGYWLAGADGGVFAFGDAGFHGSAAGQRLRSQIVDLAPTASGNGYWLVGSDGGVFSFGDAPFLGAPAGRRLNAPVVGIAGGIGRHEPPPAPPEPPPPPASPAPGVVPAPAGYEGRLGWDISYPQCGGNYPPPGDYAIIGVNGGRAFKHNRCLADEWRWATAGPAGVYINVNFPRGAAELALGATGPQPNCAGALPCIAANFGWNGAMDSLAYAASQGVDVHFVWLDVETMNYWTNNRPLNALVVQGAIDALRSAGKGVGIYSTPFQWRTIAGDYAPGVPVWSAGAPDLAGAERYCTERAFAGGPVAMVQLLPIRWDQNLLCPSAGPLSTYFRMPR